MEGSESEKQHKSSAEILSELFSAFNAKPPDLCNDTENSDKSHKKHKKSKKKHKHKDKKHKKKSKRRSSRSSSSFDSDSDDSSSKRRKKKAKKKLKDLGLDLDTIFKNTVLVKQEPNLDEIKIKQEKDNGYEKFEMKIKPDPEATKSDSDTRNENKDILSTYNKDDENNKNNKDTNQQKRITIKNLKNSIIYENALKEKEIVEREKTKTSKKYEDGEILESDGGSESDEIPNDHILDDTEFRKSSSKHDSTHKHDRKRKHSHDKDRYDIDKRSRHESKHSRDDKHKQKKIDDREMDHRHNKHRIHRSTSRDRDRHNLHSKHRRNSRDDIRNYRSHDRPHASHDRGDHKWHRTRSRSKSRERRRRSHSPSTSKSGIDKKKLLEIARRNAINMLKSGTLPDALTLGPTAQEKVIAAIKAGGKTIEELTDFCKNLSQKEALGELSSVSSGEDEPDIDDPEKAAVEKAFHHPFQIKDKPASIVMNIKNATALPIKSSKEKSAELLQQFPVSSGTLHRKTENEWVPVEPQTTPIAAILPAAVSTTSTALVPLPFIAPTPVPNPVPKPAPVVPLSTPAPDADISTIVSQRLTALRKLQENPNDVQALTQMHRAQRDMENWAQSKQQPGQFTGSTGANILSAAELSSGYQAWARKDQLTNAAPVSGGMGMHLLQKMGWRPGEGLGKEKSGTLEPLLLEVKLDKRGIVASGEAGNAKKVKNNNSAVSVNNRSLSSKHPVSLLGEYASKRKLGVPQYQVCFECGPDHKKNFLFKVVVNGVEYKPNVASSTKKQAKADAALVCLQHLGVLPS